VQAYGYNTGDIIFQKDGKKLWRMFEDEAGLYLENLNTGKIYSFVLREKDNAVNAVQKDNFGQVIKVLQAENQTLKERIEALERNIQQLALVKEVQQ